MPIPKPPAPDWPTIRTILLDMDGTLLDLHFDNHFWQSHLPRRYCEKNGLSPESAREELMARFHARAGTLDWYSVDFWSTELEVDVMTLKEEVAHLIAVHPDVPEFLVQARESGRRVVLATNAHHKSLTLKLARTGLSPYFDAIVSSHSLGAPKEERGFWLALQETEAFDPRSTVLIDDSLPVLDAAHAFGIGGLVAVRCPDSRQGAKETGPYFSINGFKDLLPLPKQA